MAPPRLMTQGWSLTQAPTTGVYSQMRTSAGATWARRAIARDDRRSLHMGIEQGEHLQLRPPVLVRVASAGVRDDSLAGAEDDRPYRSCRACLRLLLVCRLDVEEVVQVGEGLDE